MKKRAVWKGVLIGGIVGVIIGFMFYFINPGTSYCVKGLNLNNFFCSVSETSSEFGVLAGLVSIPRLLIKNIFKLEGMQEMFVLPILVSIVTIIGGLIGYLIQKRK